MPLTISSHFDSGAIDIVSVRSMDDIQLAIRADNTHDPACVFRQWFHFRVHGARGKRVCIRLVNAHQTTYPNGWRDYRVVASYNRADWFRVETRYDGKALIIDHTYETDSMYFAYFEPYSWERHLSFLGWAADHAGVRIERLGATVEGRDLDAIVIGSPRAARRVWVIARQHPGETMAQWCAEGLVERLLDAADPVAHAALEEAQFYIVPNMNPDGSVRGNLRANAAGANLNREWREPSVARSPEVFHVRKRMMRLGCDLFLDLHGDEALPYVFVDGNQIVPGFNADHAETEAVFTRALLAASPDFQTVHGYERERFSDELATVASKWAFMNFGCLALTLEMPFKDNALREDTACGWDSARSRRLGGALVQAVVQSLRHMSLNAQP
jgi:murein tripeptide amidase MpaA